MVDRMDKGGWDDQKGIREGCRTDGQGDRVQQDTVYFVITTLGHYRNFCYRALWVILSSSSLRANMS